MRILILQLKRLGDVVLTTPLIAAIRERLPHASVTVALDASARSLADLIDADSRILFERGRVAFWKSIAAGGWDVVLDVTGNDRSAFATALSRADRRITWQRFSKKPLRRLCYNAFVDSSVRNRHTADHHTDLLRALDIEVEDVPGRITIPPEADVTAARVLSTAGVSTPFVIVHPGTARAEKYWLPERWAEVIAGISLPVVITGGNDSAERAHIDAIRATGAVFTDLAGRLPLPVTAALIARAHLVCAVDSLPVHLADAAGTPVVALFGPTNPFHWRPRRSQTRVVTASGAEPITPAHPKGPMDAIDVRRVLAAVKSVV